MPTRGARWTSASLAVAVVRGSTTTSFGGFRPAAAVEDARPEHRLLRGDVVAEMEDGLGRVEIGVGAGLPVGAEGFLQAPRRRSPYRAGCCRPCAACPGPPCR